MSKTPETFEIAAQKVLAQHNLMNPYQLTLNQCQAMDGLLAAHTAALEAAKREAREELASEIRTIAHKYDFPGISAWKQGKFIDQRQYSHQSEGWKEAMRQEESQLIRPYGGINNALFRVEASGVASADVAAYLAEVGDLVSHPNQPKQEGGGDAS